MSNAGLPPGDVGWSRHRTVRGDADYGRHLGRGRFHQWLGAGDLQRGAHLDPGALRIRLQSVHK